MSENLIKAANEYIKYRLWDKIEEDDIFAVELSSGEVGYVSVCGPEANGGEGLPESGCSTLELYRGDAAIESMLDAHVYSDVFDKSEFAGFEKFFAKDCLMLRADESGATAFIKALPYRGRQEIKSTDDENLLTEAIKAAIFIGKGGWPEVEEALSADSGERSGKELYEKSDGEAERIPLIAGDGGENGFDGYYFSKLIDLPEPCSEIENMLKPEGEVVEMINELPKNGNWECELIFLPEPKVIKEGEPPYFDHMIMLVNNSTGASLVTEPVRGFLKDPGAAGEAFIRLLELRKVRPEAIIARDDRTFSLLEPVCEALDIDLGQSEELPILDAVQSAILHQDKEAQKKAEEEFEKFIDSLCQMPEESFALLSEEVLNEVRVLLEMGVITGERGDLIKGRLKI